LQDVIGVSPPRTNNNLDVNMVWRFPKYSILLALIILMPFTGCISKSEATRAQREANRNMELRRQEGERIMRDAQKRHKKVQGRETRQRMRETRRKSDRLMENRREPFFIRWITSSRRR